jgi:hypothetical protein
MVDRADVLALFHSSIGVAGFVCDSSHLLKSPDALTRLLNAGFLISTYEPLNNIGLCHEVLDKRLKCT